MAKNLTIGGKSVTTDEDWYEIDAWGKRTGARHFDQGAGGIPGAGTGAGESTALGGGTATPPSLAGINQASGAGMPLEGGEQISLPQTGAIRQGMGRRLMPDSAAPLAGKRLY